MTFLFDTIYFDNNYYFGRQNNIITLFTKDKGTQLLTEARAIHNIPFSHGVYQVLKGNNLYWLDGNKQITKTEPKFKIIREVCGNIEYYECKIRKDRDSLFYDLTTKSDDNESRKKYKRLNITRFISKNSSITFLNNLDHLEFDENNLYTEKLDHFTFIETLENNRMNIIKLIMNDDSIINKKILLEQADKLFLLSKGLNVSRFQPFQFQKNGLYGYYPYNKNSRYLFLNQLNFNFARFELPNGKRGWLDNEGKEYLDE